jgi:hypothetical protein
LEGISIPDVIILYAGAKVRQKLQSPKQSPRKNTFSSSAGSLGFLQKSPWAANIFQGATDLFPWAVNLFACVD